jgi:DNA-binding FadR family transcriptional regulator
MESAMAIAFSSMKPRKSYEHVVEQIQTAICDGNIAPGERLPSEMKLKDMFETSRGTVREALRVLEQKGLVSIRTGVKGGARVKPANTEAMKDSMALLIQHKKISLEHLAQFRVLLEGETAERAAQNPSPDALAALTAIMDRIHELTASGPEDWEGFNRLDGEFHLTLARMGGNPLVEANLETIHQNIHTYFQQYLPFSLDLLKEDVADLSGILKAVSRGDEKGAGALARAHVQKFTALMAGQIIDTEAGRSKADGAD